MNEEDRNETLADICDQQGHLSELTINRYLAGEFSGEMLEEIEAHLQSDSLSQERLDEVVAFDAKFAIPMRSLGYEANKEIEDAVDNVVNLAEVRERKAWVPFAAIMATAAALFLMFNMQNAMHESQGGRPVGDGADMIRLKGSALTLEVFRKTGNETFTVHHGDVVQPGDRIGFRVTAKDDGFLMIVGVDQKNEVYPCYPQVAGAPAVFVRGNSRAQDLKAAIELDDVLGAERFVALLCESEITYQEASKRALGIARARAKAAGRDAGCVFEQLSVTKTAKR